VVEDESIIAENIIYALKTDGFHTSWCVTAGEAREIIADKNVDLVILDVGLPDMNGFDLCREIRQTSSMPVIFLTARTDEVDRIIGLELGGDDYVLKPFSPRELTARVKAVLRRSTRRTLAKNNACHFSIDHHRMLISYYGIPLELSRYEYRILEILIGRPGWVFSRDTLMDLAWEEPEASLDRTVDTHIKRLRAKLRAVRPDKDPIQTRRGAGYLLRETQ